MDYFFELLDSFQKLKKRNLKFLVEEKVESTEDPAAEQAASQAYQQAMVMEPFPTYAHPHLAQGARASVAIFYKQSSKASPVEGWKFGPLNSGGGVGKSKFLETDWNEFVGYFRQDGATMGDAQPGQEGQTKAGPGETVGGSELAEQFPTETQEIIDQFAEISNLAPELYEAIPNDIKEQYGLKSQAHLETLLWGARPGTIENAIVFNKEAISWDAELKQYVTVKVPVDAVVAKAVVGKIKSLVRAVVGFGDISDSKEDILYSFKRQTIGNKDFGIGVLQDINDSGLVFSNNGSAKTLRMLMDSLEKHFDDKEDKFETINANRIQNKGSDNVARGISLEEIQTPLSLARQIIMIEEQGGNAKALRVVAKETFDRFSARVRGLRVQAEGWVRAFKYSAQSPETASIIASLQPFIENPGAVIKAMITVGQESIDKRSPTIVVGLGKTAGAGKRVDTMEVYRSPEEAFNALKKSGFSREEAQRLVAQRDYKNLRKYDDKLVDAVSKAGLIDKKMPVSEIVISLKHYMSLKEAKFGEATSNSTSDMIQGKTKDPNFYGRFREITGQTSSDLKNARNYDKAIQKVSKDINKLSTNAVTRSKSTKNVLKSKPLVEFADNLIKTITDNSTYEDLNKLGKLDPERKNLLTLAQGYVKADSADEKKYSGNKLKEYSSMIMTNKKVLSDIRKGKPEARQYLAMKLFNTAGVVDERLICDWRGLATGERHLFTQSEVIDPIINSIFKGDGEWEVVPAGRDSERGSGSETGFTFRHSVDKDLTVTLTDRVAKKESNDLSKGYRRSSSCVVSRELQKKFNRLNKKSEEVPAEEDSKLESIQDTIEAFMLIQEKFLNQLAESKK